VLRAVAETDTDNGWWEVVAATGAAAPSSSEVMDAPLEFKEFERGIIDVLCAATLLGWSLRPGLNLGSATERTGKKIPTEWVDLVKAREGRLDYGVCGLVGKNGRRPFSKHGK
jgi:hypothetical protein